MEALLASSVPQLDTHDMLFEFNVLEVVTGADGGLMGIGELARDKALED